MAALSRGLPKETEQAVAGKRQQGIVRPLAVVVDAPRLPLAVGRGDRGGEAIEHGERVEPLGQQPELLLRDGVEAQ